ncbi:TfoX/Sxy family protein [Dyella terrae]|uniref:TfoX/Sxy family protein n=1 Tax=Dyella terrae TaxID=522259 RepID=UPI001EFE560D|nr:TfoX/Sxy family protein [Dyella terrae]ULU25317.1 TfoX/Sxy family protein [Dyella terrae]
MNADIQLLRKELEDAATHLGRPHDLRFKPMFGGLMAWFDEKPCAWLSAQGLALRLAEADQAELLAEKGAARFRHRPDEPPSRDYILVPSALRRDTARFSQWLERSSNAPAPQKKRPRPKTRPR